MQDTTLANVTPLNSAQKRAGATFASPDGRQVPHSYGNSLEEYRAAREGVALVDRSAFGRLRIKGTDGPDLLNRLSTNKLIDLSSGEGASTILTTAKGRIVDLLLVIHMGDELLVVTSPQTSAKVVEWIDFYTFGEDIAVEDVTEEAALLSLIGPRSGALLREPVSTLDLFGAVQTTVQGVELTVIRTDAPGIAGYDLLVPASQAVEVWEGLLNDGAVPMGEEALEMLRIEQGVPRYGRELGEDFNPLEAGLTPSISFDKGCYTGQEVVLRLQTYNKVQRHLAGIAIKDGSPQPGARLEVDGKAVGQLTSVAHSPKLGHTLALGYVRAGYPVAGQEVGIRSGDHLVQGRVLDLPLEKRGPKGNTG